MPIDMKEIIAETANSLIFEKKLKKITVKDIVAECNITRQAFYYHFEDIPELLKWILEKNAKKTLEVCLEQKDPESALRYFFRVAINIRPYAESGVQSNYGAEVEKLLNDSIYIFFRKAWEKREVFDSYSEMEQHVLLKYHSQAIIGILKDWTKEDTKNMDEIVHQVHLILQGKKPSF